MKRVTCVLMVCVACVGCGSDGYSAAPGQQDAGGEEQNIEPDGDVSDAPVCNVNGVAACKTVIGALCDRTVSCCGTCTKTAGPAGCSCLGESCEKMTGGDSVSCAYTPTGCSDTCSASTCGAWMMMDSAKGHNCLDTKFVDGTACQQDVDACLEQLPLVACSDITGASWNWPPACEKLWGEF